MLHWRWDGATSAGGGRRDESGRSKEGVSATTKATGRQHGQRVRAVGVRSRGCSNDGDGNVIAWTAGGRRYNELDGGAANDAMGAGGDNYNNRLDWAENFATKAGRG